MPARKDSGLQEPTLTWSGRKLHSRTLLSGNSPLHAANRAKRDEFYTQLSDIENEPKHYCDDPRASKFFHCFSFNFAHLGLKKLATTCYRNQDQDLFSRHDSERVIKFEYDGYRDGEMSRFHLNGREMSALLIIRRKDME